jgi:hypothetical protein
MATADSLERMARKKASSSKKETDFQAASKKQQEAFDRAAYVAKSQSASKKNVAKKGEALSGFVKNAIFDWTSPEMMALSALPFGIGRVASAGAKAAPKIAAVNNMIPKPRGYSPSTRIDGVGGAAAAKNQADEYVIAMMGDNMAQYLGNANRVYDFPKRADEVARFFDIGNEFIPGGTAMYRVPSAGEVLNRLPKKVGEVYRPGSIKSAASSSDLQQLGEVLSNPAFATGGNQIAAPGIAQIFTRQDIPGIENLTKFLSRYKLDPRARKYSQFNNEYVLGPNTAYRVQDFRPAAGSNPPSWTLEAFLD